MKKLSHEKGYLIVTSLATLMTHLMGPYLTLWLKSIGSTFTQIGELQSVSSFVTFVTDFPTGGLADKYGRRLNFAVGIFLFGIALIMISLSKSFFFLLFAFILGGLGDALMSGTLIPWLYDSLGKKKTYIVLNYAKIIRGLLGAIAGIVGGILAHYALNLPLILAGLCGISSSMIAILFLEENYGHGKAKPYKEIILEGIKQLSEKKPLQYILLAGFFLSFASRSFFMFWMILARDLGLSSSGIGYVYPLLILSTSFGGAISIKLSKFMNPEKILLITTPIISFLIIAMGIIQNLLLLVVLIVLFEVTIAVRGPAAKTFKNQLIPSPVRSTVNSALNTIGSLYIMLANILIGVIADQWGLSKMYIISGVFSCFSFVFLLMALRDSLKFRGQLEP